MPVYSWPVLGGQYLPDLAPNRPHRDRKKINDRRKAARKNRRR